MTRDLPQIRATWFTDRRFARDWQRELDNQIFKNLTGRSPPPPHIEQKFFHLAFISSDTAAQPVLVSLTTSSTAQRESSRVAQKELSLIAQISFSRVRTGSRRERKMAVREAERKTFKKRFYRITTLRLFDFFLRSRCSHELRLICENTKKFRDHSHVCQFRDRWGGQLRRETFSALTSQTSFLFLLLPFLFLFLLSFLRLFFSPTGPVNPHGQKYSNFPPPPFCLFCFLGRERLLRNKVPVRT